MDIWMIWIRESDGVLWLAEAWDEDSLAQNVAGWETAKAQVYEEHKPENVVIVVTTIDLDKIREIFNTPLMVKNNGIRGEDS